MYSNFYKCYIGIIAINNTIEKRMYKNTCTCKTIARIILLPIASYKERIGAMKFSKDLPREVSKSGNSQE